MQRSTASSGRRQKCLQRVFGETYGDREYFGRDFSHRAGEDDGGIDVEGAMEEEEDADRWSPLRFRRGPTRDARAPPLGGGALGPLGFAMSILRC